MRAMICWRRMNLAVDSGKIRGNTRAEIIHHSVWVKVTGSFFFLQAFVSMRNQAGNTLSCTSSIPWRSAPAENIKAKMVRAGLAFALHLVHLGAATWQHSWPRMTPWRYPLPFKDHAVQWQVVCLLWCHSQGSSIVVSYEKESTFIIWKKYRIRKSMEESRINVWWFARFCESVSQMEPLSCRFCCAGRSACHTCARVVAERCVRILWPTDIPSSIKFTMITNRECQVHLCRLRASQLPGPDQTMVKGTGTEQWILYFTRYCICNADYIPESVPVVCSQAHIYDSFQHAHAHISDIIYVICICI